MNAIETEMERLEQEHEEHMRKLRVEKMKYKLFEEDFEPLAKILYELLEVMYAHRYDDNMSEHENYDKGFHRWCNYNGIVKDILEIFFMDDEGYFLTEDACKIWRYTKTHTW